MPTATNQSRYCVRGAQRRPATFGLFTTDRTFVPLAEDGTCYCPFDTPCPEPFSAFVLEDDCDADD